MTLQFQPGQPVRLVPSQGGHQKEREGHVGRVTETQVVVLRVDTEREMRFRLADGRPVAKMDQQFPCYFVKPY